MTGRRILHVIQNLNYGGMERLLADLVRRTSAHGFENHVLVLQYAGRFAHDLEGYGTVHHAGPMRRGSLLWPAALTKRMRALRPDVVHSHSGVWYKTALAARRAGVGRVIHTEHGLRARDTWLARLVERRAARRTTIIVAVSDALRDILASQVASAERIRVIRNGVDTQVFQPRPDTSRLRGELGIPSDTPIIGSIGRLEQVKGYDVLLRAFAQLRPLHLPIPPVLVLAGDGSERQALEAQARAAGLAATVHFLGWRDDVDHLHSAFTVFTMSSRSEGTSISLLEAMSAGICPVVTDVGGNRAVLGPALTHRLVRADHPDRLAEALRDALTDSPRRLADAHQARRRVEDAFALEAMVQEYEALYLGRA